MNPYRYFSLLFSSPTVETVRELRELSQTEGLSGFRSADALLAAPLEEAQTEYTRLFVSSYPSLLCPPYESYYREGIVYGNSSVEMVEWYRKHGLAFSAEGEPADLLSAELEFLALTNDASLLVRMKEWVFEFTGRVIKHSALYGPGARDLEELLQRDLTRSTAEVPA